MNVLYFPLYVKAAHFCFASLLLGFYGGGADIQLFCELMWKRIIVHNIMNTTKNFTLKGPCSVKYMPIIVQQDATIYSLFISVNRSTCFGWYLQPSSEAHVAVSTASGTRKP